MVKRTLKIQQLILIFPLLFALMINCNAQYKDFKLSPTGDTLNAVDKNGLKQAKWVNTIGEIRGEGASFKKKEDTHRMAEANKAFAHFRI